MLDAALRSEPIVREFRGTSRLCDVLELPRKSAGGIRLLFAESQMQP